MQSPSSKAIDRMIRLAPHGGLKKAGFRKVGRTFWKAAGDLVQVVHFQASQWNTPEAARFTVNVGVTFPLFHEAVTGRPFPKNPGAGGCVVGWRLGLLMPENRDRWWTSPGDEDEQAREIAEALADYAAPALERMGSRALVLQHLLSEDRPDGVILHPAVCRAILLVDVGRSGEAARVLREAVEFRGERNTFIEAVARRLDCDLHA